MIIIIIILIINVKMLLLIIKYKLIVCFVSILVFIIMNKRNSHYHYHYHYWKLNFHMNSHVRLLVSWLVRRPVCHNFLKRAWRCTSMLPSGPLLYLNSECLGEEWEPDLDVFHDRPTHEHHQTVRNIDNYV